MKPVRQSLRGSSAPRPQLTSLVDMMTILLVFLLQSFSADNEFAEAAKGIELPTSRTEAAEMEATASIEVSPTEISVDGQFVLAINSLDPANTPLAPLHIALQGATEAASVSIQCDRSHTFSLLKRVMVVCSEEGLTHLSLVVDRSAK